MKNIFVLVNPASANGSTRTVWPQIAAYMEEKGLKFEARITTAALEAPDLVRAALVRGFDTIVAVGGDGTVNEVVNGFFDGPKPINPNARLGIISRGTGCDFIRTMGIPKDFKQAVDLIANNHETTIDLGLLEYTDHNGQPASRRFANISDAGLGATVCNRVNRKSKSSGGLLSYLTGTLWSILSYKCISAVVTADGKVVHDGLLAMAAVANGRYFGGGMHLSPNSKPDDGLLELVLLGGMAKPQLLANLARVYKGTHLSHPKVSILPVREVTVVATMPACVETDGEVPGSTPLRFTVEPGVLRLLV